MAERTTIRLPQDLLRRAKRKAVAEDRTLTSLIADGLRLILAEKPKGARPKRIMPRISKAGGGPMPGLELTSAELQQLDDFDYVRRLKQFQ